MLIALTTTPDAEEARKLAETVISAGLAACVQVLPAMTSYYVWEGKTQIDTEHLLLIKTLPEKWDSLRDLIATNHSYEVPEIVCVEAEKVSEPYQTWLAEVLR